MLLMHRLQMWECGTHQRPRVRTCGRLVGSFSAPTRRNASRPIGKRTITDRTTTRSGEARKKNGDPVVTVSFSLDPPRVLLERSAGVSRRSVPFPRKPWRSSRDGTPRSLRFHPRASGSTQAATSFIAKTEEASEQERVFKDKDIMFFNGSVLVRELLKLGFQVRSGVRSAQTVAEPLGQLLYSAR
ncbi:hypothetical protein OPV22_014801 [Ensete ventricosum]|uniref:Uncharacterized protein n=1 Tax=Ensete ventricosum TaxID=4639 RepID=A0AAV8R2E8_ENSVE|nr:hypothetical protein OPV22_014801 [Ensete ventricosum]